MAGGITVPDGIAERAGHLAEVVGEELESILYYEHPFTACGLLVVVSDRAQSYVDVLATIYQALQGVVPKVHCLRRRELFQLALPGCGPALLDDQPHLAHCVKYRSALLYGKDYRAEIPLPADPGLFLRAHVRDYRHHLRVHFLKLLAGGEYRKLAAEAVVEARRLLSTAAMGKGGLAERRSGAGEVAAQLEALAAPPATGPDGGSAASAIEAFWLLERLVRQLAEGTP